MNAHLYQYFEVCIPTPFNSTAFFSDDKQISINVIGYVGTAPSSFDLIVDPFIYLRSSLKSISVVNGEKPTEIMLANTFANCTGKLRFFDKKKLFIDTPLHLVLVVVYVICNPIQTNGNLLEYYWVQLNYGIIVYH